MMSNRKRKRGRPAFEDLTPEERTANALAECKAYEEKNKRKLHRINISNGYILTNNPKMWSNVEC